MLSNPLCSEITEVHTHTPFCNDKKHATFSIQNKYKGTGSSIKIKKNNRKPIIKMLDTSTIIIFFINEYKIKKSRTKPTALRSITTQQNTTMYENWGKDIKLSMVQYKTTLKNVKTIFT